MADITHRLGLCERITDRMANIRISQVGHHGPLTRYVKLWLRMRRGCREFFPRHGLQRKPLVNDPGMHHGTCVTHVPWCMSGSLTRGCEENVPGIPGACATRNFTYLARGPLVRKTACRLFGAKLLSYPMRFLWDLLVQIQSSFEANCHNFEARRLIGKGHLQNRVHAVPASVFWLLVRVQIKYSWFSVVYYC